MSFYLNVGHRYFKEKLKNFSYIVQRSYTILSVIVKEKLAVKNLFETCWVELKTFAYMGM